jgi:hypothetical protein
MVMTAGMNPLATASVITDRLQSAAAPAQQLLSLARIGHAESASPSRRITTCV